MRHTWAFYRDRRPDSYEDLVIRTNEEGVHGTTLITGGTVVNVDRRRSPPTS